MSDLTDARTGLLTWSKCKHIWQSPSQPKWDVELRDAQNGEEVASGKSEAFCSSPSNAEKTYGVESS